MNTITIFYINHEGGNFNGEKLTFILQLIRNWTIKWAAKNLKTTVFAFEENIIVLQKTLMMI